MVTAAGHIDRRLDVGVTRQRAFHGLIDDLGAARVLAQDHRCQFLNARTIPSGEDWQTGGAPRAGLTPTAETLVGVEPHQGGVQTIKVQPAARKRIGRARGNPRAQTLIRSILMLVTSARSEHDRRQSSPDVDPFNPHARALRIRVAAPVR